MSDRDIPNSSLLSPNNQPQIIRSASIGNDMIKKSALNGKANGGTEDKNRLALSLSQPLLNASKDSSITHRPIKQNSSGTINRPDAFYTGSLHNIAKHRSRTSLHTEADRYGSFRSRADNVEVDTHPEVCGCIPCSQETHDTIKQMMSFSLLRDPVFILFTVSNFLTRWVKLN